MRLQNKTAIVTGGGSGFGAGIVRKFVAEGARVMVADIDADAAAEVAREVGGVAHTVDVAYGPSVRAMAGAAIRALGHVDILVNNAGITQPAKFLDISGKDYDRILDVSLRGTLYMSQAVLPAMRAQQGGSIVCISSVSAQRGGGILGGPHYSAAKAGVLGLARAMAREFGPEGIRVNCVTPGLISTDINKDILSAEKKAEIAQTIPLGRLGGPDDVGGVCVFLASDLSQYCTGITLDVNGGMLIH